MRLHITLDEEIVRELDRRVGPRGRSAFITAALERVLTDEQRWDDVEAALGGIADEGHEWDEDPAAWVRAQRRSSARRSG
jgi:hypothetical protein